MANRGLAQRLWSGIDLPVLVHKDRGESFFPAESPSISCRLHRPPFAPRRHGLHNCTQNRASGLVVTGGYVRGWGFSCDHRMGLHDLGMAPDVHASKSRK